MKMFFILNDGLKGRVDAVDAEMIRSYVEYGNYFVKYLILTNAL